MEACPVSRVTSAAGVTRRSADAPWRWHRQGRHSGLARAPRTAPLCRLWRLLFPARAARACLAEILANIAPYVLRRAGRGTRHARAPLRASRQSGWHGSLSAPCGSVPVAARAGSGR